MHRRLNRQLKNYLGKKYDFDTLDPKMQQFCKDIEATYISYEKDREFFEHILKLNSDELYESNKKLREVNQNLEQRVETEVAQNRKKDRQIMQQSRLAQMGEMISMIAHQWRQPLNAISATSNKLQLGLMLDDKIDREVFQKEISLIAQYSQHLSKTIDDFRGFFKNNKTKEVTTLEKIIKSTLDIVKVSVENKNINIVVSFECNTEFETYPSEIKQVVLNLIKNAEDALLENRVQDPVIMIETFCDSTKKSKELIIRDNAGGIPADIIDKIFDPYFSTKLDKNGTGLGLYMSKTIIQEHCNGSLKVSNDRQGAVFQISF